MWSIECSNGASSADREVAVDPDEPSGFAELVDQAVLPVPAPGEPARELALRCDDGRANAGAEEVAERLPGVAPAARLRVCLVPAEEEARVPVGLLVDERPGDDRPAALERRSGGSSAPSVSGPAPSGGPRARKGRRRRGARAAGAQSSSAAAMRASSARQMGSRSAATSSVTRRLLPRWTARMRCPRAPSRPNHGNFVAGHWPKPGLSRAYGSSWHASNRLGSAESAVRVRRPRSRRNASASSSVSSARSGVRRHSYARRSSSSAKVVTLVL